MTDHNEHRETVSLLRSRGITIEQMSAALPILFEHMDVSGIEVYPYPILMRDKDKPPCLVVIGDENTIFLDYDFVMKGFKEEPLQ